LKSFRDAMFLRVGREWRQILIWAAVSHKRPPVQAGRHQNPTGDRPEFALARTFKGMLFSVNL
jgi:hypothetical protein